MRQNFSEEAHAQQRVLAHAAMKAALRGSRCERLRPRAVAPRRLAHRDRHAAGAVADEGAEAARADSAFVQRRRVDHAEHRLAVLDQGDVDGELAVLVDELARAVEGSTSQ
jgi:hypothetical protein